MSLGVDFVDGEVDIEMEQVYVTVSPVRVVSNYDNLYDQVYDGTLSSSPHIAITFMRPL